MPFHAQGRGDRALDELVREGMIAGVIEVTPRGMAEEMLGGNGGGGPDRVLAAAECGVPQVVAPSGFDLLAVGGQPEWEERYAGRALAVIDELRVLVRTSADECRAIARELAARLNRSTAPFLVLLPLRGWSSLDREGCALYDPMADQAFADELAARLDRPERIRTVDANLYSAEFGVACVEAFLEVWAEAGTRPLPERVPAERRRSDGDPGLRRLAQSGGDRRRFGAEPSATRSGRWAANACSSSPMRGCGAIPAFAGLMGALRGGGPDWSRCTTAFRATRPTRASRTSSRPCADVQPDVLVAVGGGSPIDAAKCANLVFTHGGRPLDYAQGGPRAAAATVPAIAGFLLPLIAVPTTAGTASEVTSVSVIVDTERGRKVSISGPRLVPDVSVLDAEMTVSLPPHLTAYTGMDACTHLVEAYVSSVGFAPADGVALAGLGLIGRALPAAVAHPDDLEAREQMLLIAMMGGIAFNHNRLGLVHAMAHQLSTVCGLHHGLANALLLPWVMEFNLPAAPEKFAQVARALGRGERRPHRPKPKVRRASPSCAPSADDIGIPRSLAEAGVSADAIPAMVELALADSALRRNPRPVTAADVEQLYRAAFAG